MTDVSLVFVAQTVVLIALSLLFLYPAVAYADNVMHTEAVILLAVSLLVFTASAVVDQFFGLWFLGKAIHVVSDLTFTLALWLFARDFLDLGGAGAEEFRIECEPRSGGFDRAGDD